MDYFDKKINQLYSDDKSPKVPEEYSWDNMSSGIYDKMDERPRRKPIWLFFFSSMVLIMIASILFFNTISSGTTEYNHEDGTFITDASISQTEMPTIDHIHQGQDELSAQENKIQPREYNKVKDSYDDKSSTPLSATYASKNTEKKIEKTSATKSTILIERSAYEADSDTESVSNINYGMTTTSDIPSQSNKETVANKSIFISSIDTRVPSLDYSGQFISAPTPFSPYDVKEPSATKNQSIKVSTGTLWGTTNIYSSDSRAYISQVPGLSASFDYRHDLNTRWFVDLGVRYDMYRQLFEFSAIDSIAHDEVVIGRYTNTASGVVTEYTADDVITQLRQRRNLHNNQYSYIGLNGGIGLRTHFTDRISMTTSIGISIGRLIQQDILGLDHEHEVVEYADMSLSLNSMTYDAQVKLGLTYALSDQLDLILGFRLSQSLNERNTLSGSNFQSVESSFGLAWRW